MASRSKRRKIELARAAPKPDAQRVRDVTYNELYQSIVALGRLQQKQHHELQLLADNLAEISLRVRYIMQHFKFARGAKIVGADGREVIGEVATLFDLYMKEREPFLASLSRELHDAASADSNAGAESGEQTDSRRPPQAAGSPVAAATPGPRFVHVASYPPYAP